ncbi:hypothetical protein AMTRI_Chr13g85780 [Amborella trichopoda]
MYLDILLERKKLDILLERKNQAVLMAKINAPLRNNIGDRRQILPLQFQERQKKVFKKWRKVILKSVFSFFLQKIFWFCLLEREREEFKITSAPAFLKESGQWIMVKLKRKSPCYFAFTPQTSLSLTTPHCVIDPHMVHI